MKGFTLIEILIVIAIMGIFIVAVLQGANPLEQIRKANDTSRKSDIAQLQRALELYYQDNGRYPQSSVTYGLSPGGTTINWGSPWQPYLPTLPTDPVPTRVYVYYSPVASNGQTYYLYASLERGAKDLQACNSGNACTSLSGGGFPAANSCGGTCNYGVTSPNVSP